MKNIIFRLILIMAVSAVTPVWAAPASPRNMTFPPLKYEIPKTERVVLGNGMIVHLLQDRELPTVTVTAYVGTGSVYEPAEKTGLALLTGAVMRSGGTAGTPAEKFDDELEFLASSVESAIGKDAGIASMNCLTKNLDRTLRLFSEMLMNPAFRQDRVELARKNALEALRRENDNPQEVADRELNRQIYLGSPLGRHPKVETISAITREDMVAFHGKYYRPNNVILAVAGDFSRDDILARLGKVFAAGWKRENVSFPPVPVPEPSSKGSLFLIKKDINQSVIRMGHLGVSKDNPDIYALRVMNFILGGSGFESRLMREIRTREGLAYNVDSDFSIGRRFPGSFTAETETKAESTVRAIELMRSIIAGMTASPVSEEEIRQARDAMTNAFIFAFTSSAAVATQRAMLEYYGYPDNYLENFRGNIAKVTSADVLRVARKYLRPEAMQLVVAGDESAFDKPLSTLGEVREIKLKE